MAVPPAGLRAAGVIPAAGGAVPGAEDASGDDEAKRNDEE